MSNPPMVFLRRSPIYWSAGTYDWMLRLLYGDAHSRVLEQVSNLIPDGSSVCDVCCGTGQLYFQFLKTKGCDYVGLDGNASFVGSLENKGVRARLCEIRSDPIEEADFVTVCSSFYHFYHQREEVLAKLRAAARIAVIISEPLENLSSYSLRPISVLARWLTNPGIAEYRERFDLETFREFAESNGASQFIHQSGDKNALAVFPAP